MNLIATSDFRNPDLQLIEADSELINPLHIHKGARFSIGESKPFDKLNAAQKRLIVELNAAGRIVEDTQKELVARIDAEVKQEKEKNAPALPKK